MTTVRIVHDDHRPYSNEVLEAEFCVGDGEPWPCLAHRQADDGPDHIALSDRCSECNGWGRWTETREGSDGRDIDVDYPCGICEESGLEP